MASRTLYHIHLIHCESAHCDQEWKEEVEEQVREFLERTRISLLEVPEKVHNQTITKDEEGRDI